MDPPDSVANPCVVVPTSPQKSHTNPVPTPPRTHTRTHPCSRCRRPAPRPRAPWGGERGGQGRRGVKGAAGGVQMGGQGRLGGQGVSRGRCRIGQGMMEGGRHGAGPLATGRPQDKAGWGGLPRLGRWLELYPPHSVLTAVTAPAGAPAGFHLGIADTWRAQAAGEGREGGRRGVERAEGGRADGPGPITPGAARAACANTRPRHAPKHTPPHPEEAPKRP